MRISFAITLLLVGTWCLIGIQPQCQGETDITFVAYYVRIIRIGEDNYERFDEGTMAYDGDGKRVAIITDPRSQSRRVLMDFICYDPNSPTRFKNVAVLLDGKCEESVGHFYNLLVPTEDDFKGSIIAGGPGEQMSESIYFGESTRERNDVILTTSGCHPIEYAISDQERNFHFRMNFYNHTASLPTDAFKISCSGQQDVECPRIPPSHL